MVARLVTSERDLRFGPFAHTGVRSIVRGRRPELPPVCRVSAYAYLAPGRWRGQWAAGPGQAESKVDGVRAPPADIRTAPTLASATPGADEHHQERQIGGEREQAQRRDERCPARLRGQRHYTMPPFRDRQDGSGSLVNGRRSPLGISGPAQCADPVPAAIAFRRHLVIDERLDSLARIVARAVKPRASNERHRIADSDALAIT